MAVIWESQTAQDLTANSASWVLNKPASVAAGDLLVAYLFNQSELRSVTSAPSGWTQKLALATTINNPWRYECWYKIADGSEGSTFTFGWDAATGSRGYAVIARYTGVDQTTPLDTGGSAAEVPDNSFMTTPSMTPAVDDCLIITTIGQDAGAAATTPSYTADTGWTERLDAEGTNGDLMVGIFEQLQGTAAAIDHTIDVDNAGIYGILSIMAIRPAAGGVADTDLDLTPITAPIAVGSDTLTLSLGIDLSAIAAVTAVPSASLQPITELDLSALPVSPALPAAQVSLALDLSLSPIAASIDVPVAALSTLVDLALSAIPVSIAVPTSTIGVGGATTNLDLSPIAYVMALPTAELATQVTLALSALPVSLASPSVALRAITTLELAPISIPISAPAPAMAFSLDLGLSPIPVVIAMPTLTFEGGQIVTGSDLQFVMDCIAFWAAYDALGTEAARRQLYREFLLTHGGRIVVERGGFLTIIGAAEPVRVDVG